MNINRILSVLIICCLNVFIAKADNLNYLLNGNLNSNLNKNSGNKNSRINHAKIYTFDSLLSHTLKTSANLSLSKLEIDSSLNELNYAKSSFYPEIGISANSEYSKRFDNGYNSVSIGKETLSSSTSYSNSASLVLNYDLYTFGRDSLKVKSANESIKKARFQECETKLEISLKLLEAYHDALLFKDKIQTKQALQEAYEKLYLYQKRLNNAGEIDRLVLANSAMALADNGYELSQLKLNAKHRINVINQITGLKIKNLDELSPFKPSQEKIKFAKFEDTFIAKKFEYELSANEFAKEAEEKSYYPTISLYARYDLYGNDYDSYRRAGRDLQRHGYRFGVSFYANLFDGGKRDAKIKDKEIASQKIRLKKEIARLEYEKESENLELFLSQKDKIGEILKELDTLSQKTLSMQTRLNKAKENSKIDILNSLISSLKKELDYKEHALKVGYNITKANLMNTGCE